MWELNGKWSHSLKWIVNKENSLATLNVTTQTLLKGDFFSYSVRPDDSIKFCLMC